MKLITQINLAFGALLVLVFGVIAVIIHTVLLDHFMGKQQEELQTLSTTLSQTIVLQDTRAIPSASFKVRYLPAESDIEAIILDGQSRVVSSTLSPQTSAVEVGVSSAAAAMPMDAEMRKIVEGKDKRFLTGTAVTRAGDQLTLVSPVSKVREIEMKLFSQLLIVLCTGFIVVFLLGLFMTKRIIHPLMRLREELKKVRGRKYAEVELVKATGEIGAVAETVYDLAQELDQYHRVQKQFFQNASHELKSPLMSIFGYAEGIRDGVFEGESMRRGLEIIMSEGNRVKKLVTEMTLLAKLDSEEDIFQFERIAVKDMLLETEERVNPMLMKNNLQLQIQYHMDDPEALQIHADQDKLLQALLNVVTNSIRHAKEEIHIHVRQQGNHVLISVQDDGEGIPEQLLPTLFHRFVKGKGGESGLGLAIARAIVERCGGKISAMNRDAGGAMLDFDFPMCRA
ncbi:sensor histidine kinase [Paenibacillus guangzhouensis]|uniref:sensor histidine kinase n=1 Tax=Paenibacillus guangzhouensis TaxID=1473112 RepID=UPI0012676726|nr:HAMP domain-containing sensor histidine kinase [Paenibacillus guangzhouensis]